MARQPIVLTSNLIPNLEPNTGALANIYSNKDPVNRDPIVENEDGTFTIPTYERTVVDDIPDDFDWSMYGRAGPTLRYFHRVRTGEIEYDPSNDVVDPSTLTDTSNPDLPDAAEVLKQELISVGTQLAAGVGAQVGRAYAQTGNLSDSFSEYGKGNFAELLGFGASNDPTRLTSKISSSGPFNQSRAQFELASLDTDAGKAASLALKSTPKNPLDADASTKYLQSIEDNPNLNASTKDAAKLEYKTAMASIPEAPKSYLKNLTDRGKSFGPNATAAGRANLYGSAGAGLGAVAANLIAGRNLKDSVKSGVKVGAGTYVGTLIGGPIGGLVGGLFGGRVICNELMRQGVMTRKQVVLDYKFTRDHLTPTHVNGYHVWAVWMVKQMRKGRFVPFWKHVAGHRANEIAYIYGERDKPDYLGKVYRKVLEPICWSIGFFCKKTDWTVLYKQKEV
mgnify:FL=1